MFPDTIQLNMNNQSTIRQIPKKGTILRVQLADGYSYYCCVVSSISMWLYGFRTELPAQGSAYFDRSDWKVGIRFFELPTQFVNCGFVKLGGLPYTYTPVAYEIIPEDRARSLGFRYNTVVPRAWNARFEDLREVSPEEIIQKGYAKDKQMDAGNFELMLSEYIPRLELREVPPKFVDKRDPALLIKPVKEPKLLTIRVTLREVDLATDDIEPDIEEPLQEALEDAECGTWVSSGTAPGGLFDIDFETAPATCAKCLKVIERTLKKLGCPESTTVEVMGEP